MRKDIRVIQPSGMTRKISTKTLIRLLVTIKILGSKLAPVYHCSPVQSVAFRPLLWLSFSDAMSGRHQPISIFLFPLLSESLEGEKEGWNGVGEGERPSCDHQFPGGFSLTGCCCWPAGLYFYFLSLVFFRLS